MRRLILILSFTVLLSSCCDKCQVYIFNKKVAEIHLKHKNKPVEKQKK